MKLLPTALMIAALALPAIAVAADDHGRRGHDQGRGRDIASVPQIGRERVPTDRSYGGPGGDYRTYGPAIPAIPAPVPGYRGRPGYAPPMGYRAPGPYGDVRQREPGDWNDYGPSRGGPAHWRRGQFFPPAYRGEALGDYYRYHLRRPPPGYYWYRNGDDFILAAVASGLIFEVVSGEGY